MTGAAFAFPRQHRLRKKPDFDRVFERSLRSSDAHFTVLARPNELGSARLGLAVSVKSAGGGVPRNRLKRTVRESFRQTADLPALDFVVTARAGAADQPAAALRASLAHHWRQLAERCARS
jgi:ribonuclease P protein component